MKQSKVTPPPSSRPKHSNHYGKTILGNGVRIVTEEVPHLYSASLGIWIRSGSRFETPSVNGICHFIEHMLFKGTARRSAYVIAKEIDSVGGVLNAFTSKEMTSFYCRVLSENLPLAVDLLTDIFLNPSFPEDEIEREKQVVCQEIAQLEDSPEDLVHEILGTRFWLDDPLGQPILGTIPNIMNFDRETISVFKRNNYVPGEIVICAAGKLQHEAFVDLFAEQMDRIAAREPQVFAQSDRRQSISHIEERDSEQVHVCVAVDGPSAVDEKRHAGYILNTILGGGMSSRLFQEIREKRGLAYSVYSFLSSLSDTGMFGIYAGCDPARLEELITTMGKETLSLAATLTEDDVRTAKAQLKGNIILATESSESRMNRLAKGEYYFGRYVSVDEIISAIEKVTVRDLSEMAEEMINGGQLTVVALGPLSVKTDLLDLFKN
ncbi:MAG: insulinase family protein [Desulfomonile tiedjei]|nr:insulinase family protein [Desulfomonile tiedjei]